MAQQQALKNENKYKNKKNQETHLFDQQVQRNNVQFKKSNDMLQFIKRKNQEIYTKHKLADVIVITININVPKHINPNILEITEQEKRQLLKKMINNIMLRGAPEDPDDSENSRLNNLLYKRYFLEEKLPQKNSLNANPKTLRETYEMMKKMQKETLEYNENLQQYQIKKEYAHYALSLKEKNERQWKNITIDVVSFGVAIAAGVWLITPGTLFTLLSSANVAYAKFAGATATAMDFQKYSKLSLEVANLIRTLPTKINIVVKLYTIIQSSKKGRSIKESLEIMARTGLRESVIFGLTFVVGAYTTRPEDSVYLKKITDKISEYLPTVVKTVFNSTEGYVSYGIGKVKEGFDKAVSKTDPLFVDDGIIGSMTKRLKEYMPPVITDAYDPAKTLVRFLFGQLKMNAVFYMTNSGIRGVIEEVSFLRPSEQEKKFDREIEQQQEIKSKGQQLLDLEYELEHGFESSSKIIRKMYESSIFKIKNVLKSYPVASTAVILISSNYISSWLFDHSIDIGVGMIKKGTSFLPEEWSKNANDVFDFIGNTNIINKDAVMKHIQRSITPYIIREITKILPIKNEIMKYIQKKIRLTPKEYITMDKIIQRDLTILSLMKNAIYYLTGTVVNILEYTLVLNSITLDQKTVNQWFASLDELTNSLDDEKYQNRYKSLKDALQYVLPKVKSGTDAFGNIMNKIFSMFILPPSVQTGDDMKKLTDLVARGMIDAEGSPSIHKFQEDLFNGKGKQTTTIYQNGHILITRDYTNGEIKKQTEDRYANGYIQIYTEFQNGKVEKEVSIIEVPEDPAESTAESAESTVETPNIDTKEQYIFADLINTFLDSDKGTNITLDHIKKAFTVFDNNEENFTKFLGILPKDNVSLEDVNKAFQTFFKDHTENMERYAKFNKLVQNQGLDRAFELFKSAPPTEPKAAEPKVKEPQSRSSEKVESDKTSGTKGKDIEKKPYIGHPSSEFLLDGSNLYRKKLRFRETWDPTNPEIGHQIYRCDQDGNCEFEIMDDPVKESFDHMASLFRSAFNNDNKKLFNNMTPDEKIIFVTNRFEALKNLVMVSSASNNDDTGKNNSQIALIQSLQESQPVLFQNHQVYLARLIQIQAKLVSEKKEIDSLLALINEKEGAFPNSATDIDDFNKWMNDITVKSRPELDVLSDTSDIPVKELETKFITDLKADANTKIKYYNGIISKLNSQKKFYESQPITDEITTKIQSLTGIIKTLTERNKNIVTSFKLGIHKNYILNIGKLNELIGFMKEVTLENGQKKLSDFITENDTSYNNDLYTVIRSKFDNSKANLDQQITSNDNTIKMLTDQRNFYSGYMSTSSKELRDLNVLIEKLTNMNADLKTLQGNYSTIGTITDHSKFIKKANVLFKKIFPDRSGIDSDMGIVQQQFNTFLGSRAGSMNNDFLYKSLFYKIKGAIQINEATVLRLQRQLAFYPTPHENRAIIQTTLAHLAGVITTLNGSITSMEGLPNATPENLQLLNDQLAGIKSTVDSIDMNPISESLPTIDTNFSLELNRQLGMSKDNIQQNIDSNTAMITQLEQQQSFYRQHKSPIEHVTEAQNVIDKLQEENRILNGLLGNMNSVIIPTVSSGFESFIRSFEEWNGSIPVHTDDILDNVNLNFRTFSSEIYETYRDKLTNEIEDIERYIARLSSMISKYTNMNFNPEDKAAIAAITRAIDRASLLKGQLEQKKTDFDAVKIKDSIFEGESNVEFIKQMNKFFSDSNNLDYNGLIVIKNDIDSALTSFPLTESEIDELQQSYLNGLKIKIAYQTAVTNNNEFIAELSRVINHYKLQWATEKNMPNSVKTEIFNAIQSLERKRTHIEYANTDLNEWINDSQFTYLPADRAGFTKYMAWFKNMNESSYYDYTADKRITNTDRIVNLFDEGRNHYNDFLQLKKVLDVGQYLEYGNIKRENIVAFTDIAKKIISTNDQINNINEQLVNSRLLVNSKLDTESAKTTAASLTALRDTLTGILTENFADLKSGSAFRHSSESIITTINLGMKGSGNIIVTPAGIIQLGGQLDGIRYIQDWITNLQKTDFEKYKFLFTGLNKEYGIDFKNVLENIGKNGNPSAILEKIENNLKTIMDTDTAFTTAKNAFAEQYTEGRQLQNDLSGSATLNSGIHGSNFEKIYKNYVDENGTLDIQSAALAGSAAVDLKKKAFKIEIANFFEKVATYKPAPAAKKAPVATTATVDLKTEKPASAETEATKATVDLKTAKPASAETEATIDLKPVDMTEINEQIETTKKQIIDSTAKVVANYNTIMGNKAMNVQAPVETVNSEKVAENEPLEINGIRNMLNYLRKLRLNNIFMLGTKIKNKVLLGLMNSLKLKQGLKLSLEEIQIIDQAYAEIVDTAIEAGGDDFGRAAADSLNDPSGGKDTIISSLGEVLSAVKDNIANSVVGNIFDAVKTQFFLKAASAVGDLGADFGKKGSEYVLKNLPNLGGVIAYVSDSAAANVLATVAGIPGVKLILIQGAKMTWRAYNTPEDTWLPFINQMTKLSTQYLNLPDSQVMRNLRNLQVNAERMRITRNAAFDAADAAKSAAKNIKDEALGKVEKGARDFVLGFDTLRGYNFVDTDGNAFFDYTNLPPPAHVGKFNFKQFILSNLATGVLTNAKHVKQLLSVFENQDTFETTNFSWMPNSFQQASQIFEQIGDMALRNPEIYSFMFGDMSATMLDVIGQPQSTSASSERFGKALWDNLFSENWQTVFGKNLGNINKNSITKLRHIIDSIKTVYTANIHNMIGSTDSGLINSQLYYQCEKPGGVHVLLRYQFCPEYDAVWKKMHDDGTVSIGEFYASYKNKEGQHVGQEILDAEINSAVKDTGKKAYDEAYARAYDQYKSSISDFETNESEKKIAMDLATKIANQVKKIAEADIYKIIISKNNTSTSSTRNLIFQTYRDYLEAFRFNGLRDHTGMSVEDIEFLFKETGDRGEYNKLVSSIVSGAISKGDLLTQASKDVASATKSDADAKEFLSSAQQRSTDADKLLQELEDEEKAAKVSAKKSKDAYDTLNVLNTKFTNNRAYIGSDGSDKIPYSPPGEGQLGFAKPLDITPDDFSQLSSSKSASKTTADSSSAFYIAKNKQTRLARQSAEAAKQLLTAAKDSSDKANAYLQAKKLLEQKHKQNLLEYGETAKQTVINLDRDAISKRALLAQATLTLSSKEVEASIKAAAVPKSLDRSGVDADAASFATSLQALKDKLFGAKRKATTQNAVDLKNEVAELIRDIKAEQAAEKGKPIPKTPDLDTYRNLVLDALRDVQPYVNKFANGERNTNAVLSTIFSMLEGKNQCASDKCATEITKLINHMYGEVREPHQQKRFKFKSSPSRLMRNLNKQLGILADLEQARTDAEQNT